MPAIAQPDWLWLLLLVALILLIAGCSAIMARFPGTPSGDYPPTTLSLQPVFVRTVEPLDTLSPQTSPAASRIPAATSPPIELPPPICYDAPNQSLLCLGRIDNDLPIAISNIVLDVRLLTSAGHTLQMQRVGMEQHRIEAGTSAPYRALFNRIFTPVERVSVSLVSYEMAAVPPAALIIEDERVTVRETLTGYYRYSIEARITNTADDLPDGFQAVVTLFDAERNVAGYRVVTRPQPLATGQSQPLYIEVIPLIADDTLTPNITVEPLRSP